MRVPLRPNKEPFLYRAKNFIRRSGTQLVLKDGDNTTEPLLVRMTNEEFLRPLKKFKRLVCYSNVQHDEIVHYSTAAVRRNNPFRCKKWNPLPSCSSNRYATVLPDTQPELTASPSMKTEKRSAEFDDLYYRMHARLVELDWKRFAVTTRPIMSHFDIVGMLGSFGNPVVQHVVETFKGKSV